MSASYLTPQKGGVRLHIHAQPNARKTEICGLHGDALKVKIKAPPEDGRANQELISFFAKLLEVPQSRVELASGASSRRKTLLVHGVSVEWVAQKTTGSS